MDQYTYRVFKDVAMAEHTPHEMVTRNISIKINSLVRNAQYNDAEEKALYALDGHIVVQPKYQRNYVYGDGKLDTAVIQSILRGLTLGMITLYIPGQIGNDGVPIAEVLDGQQRVTTIIRFVLNKFSVGFNGNPYNFNTLPEHLQWKILNTDIPANVCGGGELIRDDCFKRINMPGVPLTNMEHLNCCYSGEHVEELKKILSNPTSSFLKNEAAKYISGNIRRQDYLETVLTWSCTDIGKYLAEHRHDTDVSSVNNKFHAVIDWADNTFPTYYKEMKGLEWGRLYDTYHDKFINPTELNDLVTSLMADYAVTSKKGIFEYALQQITGAELDRSLLNIRLFDMPTKRTVYTRQTEAAKAQRISNCPMCAQLGKTTIYDLQHMDADHVEAWSKGGSTDINNCTMLCKTHNHSKGNR